MGNTHCRTSIMAGILKNIENETQTLYNLEYGKITEKRKKMRNSLDRNWNIARNTEKRGK